MKKYLFAIAMMLVLGQNAEAVSQKHRHSKQPTVMVDSTQKPNDAIEAYSDTTSTASDTLSNQKVVINADIPDPDIEELGKIFKGVENVFEPWVIVSLVAMLLLFLVAPLLIIFVVFYFINKNRREKYKLAQMAIQNGQPIPNEVLNDTKNVVSNDEYETGLRQMFVGIGLGIFLGIILGNLGYGIGALIFFIGLGKWYVARQARMKDPNFNNPGNPSNNNHDINNL